MNIKPLHNNVVIKQDDTKEEMYGNILVPDMGKEKPLVGEIIAVGPGSYTPTGVYIETTIQVGQTVAFPSYGGIKMSANGDDYVICKESDLLAILENN